MEFMKPSEMLLKTWRPKLLIQWTLSATQLLWHCYWTQLACSSLSLPTRIPHLRHFKTRSGLFCTITIDLCFMERDIQRSALS